MTTPTTPPTTPPTTMPQSPQPAPSPAPEAPAATLAAHPARFGLFFGIVATALTLGAIALAVFAPALTSAPQLQVPQGWQQVYNANPANDSAPWDSTGGCSLPAQGLDIESNTACPFTPTSGASLDDGVLVVAKLAPAADVSLSQDAAVVLDNSVIVLITQDGNYEICRESCDLFSDVGDVLVSGSTVAWHADAFVPNELAVLYSSDQSSVSLYVNGQYVDQVAAGLGAAPTIALATSSSGEALFTHVAIYTGSAG